MGKRTGDKYQAILDAAIAVIAEHGYHSAQISRIAQAAGVAPGTVYLYFKNKQDLLVQVFREKLGCLMREAKARLEGEQEPRAKLEAFIRQHYEALARDPGFAVVTQIELRQSDPEIRVQISQIMKDYFGIIDRIVAEGQKAGVFRDDLNPRLVRNLIFGTLDQNVTAWVLSGRKHGLTALAKPTFQLFAEGIVNPRAGPLAGATSSTAAGVAPVSPPVPSNKNSERSRRLHEHARAAQADL